MSVNKVIDLILKRVLARDPCDPDIRVARIFAAGVHSGAVSVLGWRTKGGVTRGGAGFDA